MYRLTGAVALISVGFIGALGLLHIANLPPSTITEWFALFHQNALIGLLESALMMLASFVLRSAIYLALYGTLRRVNEPFILPSLIAGITSVATAIAVHPAFSLRIAHGVQKCSRSSKSSDQRCGPPVSSCAAV